MKLKALDQVHVSAVKTDSLRPQEEFECSDDLGAELLKKHPGAFVRVDKPSRPRKPRRMPKAPTRKAKVENDPPK